MRKTSGREMIRFLSIIIIKVLLTKVIDKEFFSRSQKTEVIRNKIISFALFYNTKKEFNITIYIVTLYFICFLFLDISKKGYENE